MLVQHWTTGTKTRPAEVDARGAQVPVHMSGLAREPDLERCLYDAYVHTESVVTEAHNDVEVDKDASPATTRSWSTLQTLAQTFTRRKEIDNGEREMMRATALASTSNGDTLSVVAGRSVQTFRADDDWHVPKGGVHRAQVQSISWASDGLAFVIVQPAKLSVATRVGEIVYERDVSAAPIAFAALASLNEEAYDLISVNLVGTPALITQRVELVHGAAVGKTISRMFGEGLKKIDCASWLEKDRTLVVIGRKKSLSSTVVTTWKYFDGSDKSDAALMHLKTIDFGIDLTPRRSFFETPRALLLLSVFHDVGECLNLAIISETGALSVVQISKNGEYATKLNFYRNVCAAAWWSSEAIAIALRNGEVIVENVSTGRRILGDAPECFETVAGMISVPRNVDGTRRARILLMERPKTGGWRLISLNERTPLELVHAHMDLEEWGSALMLARQHGLDTDQIYKARWTSLPASIEGMSDWLSRISDRPWVVVQCLIACATSYETQRHILVYGLKETDTQAKKIQYSISNKPEWSWWVKLRLALLGALDRADTVHEICSGGFSPNMYQTLRQSTILDAAINAAYSGDLFSLKIIFKRHTSCLMPRIFDVLDALPETCSISSYETLLPWSNNYVSDRDFHSSKLRQNDWAESEYYLQHIDSAQAHDDEELNRRADVCQAVTDVLQRENVSQRWLQEATEELCLIRQRTHGSQMPSSRDMETWVIRRACEMDTALGQITSARQILQSAATGLQSQTLIDYAFAASILEAAVMTVFVEDDVVVESSLEEFSASDTFERMNVLFALLSEKNVTSIMSGAVRDFIDHVSHNSDERVCEILQRWILTASENAQYSSMSHVVRWFSSSKESIDVVGGAEALAAVVAEASLCQRDIDNGSLTALVDMLNDLPESVSGVPVAKTALFRLRACHLLRLRGLNISLEAIISAERSESQALDIIRTFISSFVENSEGETTTNWSILWKELLSLQSGVFHRCLTHDKILSLLVRSQLEHEDWPHAKAHIPASGTAGTVGALVGGLKELSGSVSSILPVSAAEEVICAVSAQFMQQARDIEDKYALDAEKCLKLMPLNAAVSLKLEFVSALRSLAVFGVRRPPKDVSGEVALQMVLESLVQFPESYRSPDELQSIALRLGVTDTDNQHAILLATGLKAFELSDLRASVATAVRLVRRNYAPSWELCAKVARALPLDDESISKKGTLLAFAVAHANEDVLPILLSDWQSTQAWEIFKKFEKCTADPDTQSFKPNIEGILVKIADITTMQANMRPIVNLFTHKPCLGNALDIIFKTKDEKAKEAAGAMAYALGIHGVHSSDQILSIIATQTILEVVKSLSIEELGVDTPPSSTWPSIAILLIMRDARAVSDVIDNIASGIQERLVLQTVLNLGACVHALRALRSVDSHLQLPIQTSLLLAQVSEVKNRENFDEDADVCFAKQFNSSLSSVVDAEWLAKAIPEIDAGAFTSNTADYRKRAILALAAGSSRLVRVGESLKHALRLAHAYEVDEYDVYAAHSAVLASDNKHDVVQAAQTLKEVLPKFRGKSLDIIYMSTWKSLPSHGHRGFESMRAYFDVLHACKSINMKDYNDLLAAMELIAAACPEIDLKLFVDARGRASKTNTTDVLDAIKRDVCAESNRTNSYPQLMLANLLKALDTLPDTNAALNSQNVHFSAVCSILSPPAGVCRLSSAQRWARVVDSGALDKIGEYHATEMAQCLSACALTDQRLKELNKFASEISTSLQLKALDYVLGKLDTSKLTAIPDVLDVRNRLSFVNTVAMKMPELDAHLLQILTSDSRENQRLSVIIERWISRGATFSQISTLASIAGQGELQCMKVDIDVTDVIMQTLDKALMRSSNQLGKVFDIVEKTLWGENDLDALATARTRAFAKLKEHVASNDGSSISDDYASILELMSNIMSGDRIWPGWASSNHGDGVVHIVSMRTAALLAPFVGCPIPCEEDVRDDAAMSEFFRNSILAQDCIPFDVLSQLLTMWAGYTQSKLALKPCWLAAVERALLGGTSNDALNILNLLAEQILCTSSSGLLSTADVAQILETAQKSSGVDTALVAKLRLLIDAQGIDTTACELKEILDLDMIMLAIYRNRIASIVMIDSVICDQVVSLVLTHRRGRDVLMPHILAAVTRERMFNLACNLALRLTTSTLDLFRNDIEGRIFILRKQLYARVRKGNVDIPQATKVEQTTRLHDLLLSELTSTLHTACAAALGALEIALVS